TAPDPIVVVSGASHCHHALARLAAWPKPKMRSGVGLPTSASAHGPGWDLSEQPAKPSSWKNVHPPFCWVVSSETEYVPARATAGTTAAARSDAVTAAPSARARSFIRGSFRGDGGKPILSPAPVTAPDRSGRDCAPELSRAV